LHTTAAAIKQGARQARARWHDGRD